MKKGLRAITALILSCFAVLLLMITLNSFDEPLNPEIPVLIAQESRVVATRGGAIALGLFWDVPNWQHEAQEILTGKKSSDQAPKAILKIDPIPYCRENNRRCSKEDLAQHGAEIQVMLKKAEPLLARYELLLKADSYANPFTKSFEGTLRDSEIGQWPELFRAFHLSLNFKPPQEAIQLLLLEAALLRQMLDSNDILLRKMIHLFHLGANVELLKVFLSESPDLKSNLDPDFADVYTTLSVPKISIGAQAAESFAQIQMVDTIQQQPNVLSLAPGPEQKLHQIWTSSMSSFLRPNETKNYLYKTGQSLIENQCWLTEKAEVCQEIEERIQKRSHIWTLRNHVGIALAKVVLPKLHSVYARIQTKADAIQKVAKEI
ncbi:MAG: hypothetical protein ACXWC9_01140 [Pseudobdellovibrionaceae bacterium]